ncbi:LPS assembly lipoprotein LptE [Desulfurobacterium sp.]
MWLLSRIIILLVILTGISGCGTVTYTAKREIIKHVYISPVTNRTPEEGIDILFTRAADDTFYTDSRFAVDKTPIPDETIVVKPSVDSISAFSVGYNKDDQAIEYRLGVTATIKLIKFGYKKPFRIFRITRYGFYDATGTPTEAEMKRKECIENIARNIFREVGEKLLEGGHNGKNN